MTTTTTPETKAEAERRRKAEYNARRTAAARAKRAAQAAPVQEAAPRPATAAATAAPVQEAAAPDLKKEPVDSVLDHLVIDGPTGIDATQAAAALIHEAADFLDANPDRWVKRTLAWDPTQPQPHAYGRLKANVDLDAVWVCALGACALVSKNLSIDYPDYWTTDRAVGLEVARILGTPTTASPGMPISEFNDISNHPSDVTREMRRRADVAVGR